MEIFFPFELTNIDKVYVENLVRSLANNENIVFEINNKLQQH